MEHTKQQVSLGHLHTLLVYLWHLHTILVSVDLLPCSLSHLLPRLQWKLFTLWWILSSILRSLREVWAGSHSRGEYLIEGKTGSLVNFCCGGIVKARRMPDDGWTEALGLKDRKVWGAEVKYVWRENWGVGGRKKVDDIRFYGWRTDPIIPRAVRASPYVSSSEKRSRGRKIVEGADRLQG